MIPGHSTKHGLDPWTGLKIGPKIGPKIELNFFQEKAIRIYIYRQKTLRLHNFPLNVTDLYIYLLFKALNDSHDNTQEKYILNYSRCNYNF